MASPILLRINACFRVPTRLACNTQRHLAGDLRGFSTWKPSTLLSLPGSRRRSFPFLLAATGIGLSLTSFASSSKVHCDAVVSTPPPELEPNLPPPPKSSVNLYELTFGTVCGLCAGVFVKKGARLVAFFLGGVFVLLQYLGSVSLVRVDWPRMASHFENLFYRADATGKKKPPTIGSVFRWMIDFLTANFQARASFITGFALGLRIG
ncbi:FUN14 family-domain-containing protein [Pisolithus croceorrhizus]|nr:FUN14 family-domain-containing protein [Pisolithus croceorrhizus]